MIKGVLTIFSGNLLGKIIGLLRELIIAGLYGTSSPVGAYRISQSASLIPVSFFTSDTLNSVFIPLYKRYKLISDEKAQSLFWIIQLFLVVISAAITLLLYLYASRAVSFIAPGVGVFDKALATQFVEVMALGLPFYVQSALYANLAMANDSYLLVSIRPTVQSIGMISGVLLAYRYDDLMFFSWGFTITYIFLFLFSLFYLANKKLLKYSRIDFNKNIVDFWKTIKPLLLLPILLQGNIVIEKIVASFMGIETVASVDYAKFITETGMVLLAIPIGLVGLSVLSNLDQKKTKEKLLKVVPFIFVLTIPVSFFIGIYAEPMVSLIFERGAFDQKSVNLTTSILIGLSVGFWAQVVAYVLIKALNANFKNKEVVIFMAFALLLNALFNISFYELLGPITIGLGVSIYGITLLVCTLATYRILISVLPIVCLLLIGGGGYFLLTDLITTDGLGGLLLGCFIFILYWTVYVFLFPSTRGIVLPVITRLLIHKESTGFDDL